MRRRAFLAAALGVGAAGCQTQTEDEHTATPESVTPSPTATEIATPTETAPERETLTEAVSEETNEPPTASFTVDPSGGFAPVLAKFDAARSEDEDGWIRQYSWHVDGTDSRSGPAKEQIVQPFEFGGDHTITLEIADNISGTDTARETVEFSNPSRGDYPTTGEIPFALSEFDDMMLGFMSDRRIQAATLGVMKDGDVLIERGYGWRDRATSKPMQPDTLLRIASVTKPFTAAAIRKLARENTISLEDRVFRELDVEPYAGEVADERVYDVTVTHLLDHEGGWDRAVGYDPMWIPFHIASALDLSEPPTTRQIAQYMLGQRLQFPPGERRAYSNFGYAVLSLYVEQASGGSYESYVRNDLLAPHGIGDVFLGRTLPQDRHPREGRYFHPEMVPNAMELDEGDLVHHPDGGFYLESHKGAGALIASPGALVRFLDEYWISGKPRDDSPKRYAFSGSLPGTNSYVYQHLNGANVAVVFGRRPTDAVSYEGIRDDIDRVVGRAEW